MRAQDELEIFEHLEQLVLPISLPDPIFGDVLIDGHPAIDNLTHVRLAREDRIIDRTKDTDIVSQLVGTSFIAM